MSNKLVTFLLVCLIIKIYLYLLLIIKNDSLKNIFLLVIFTITNYFIQKYLINIQIRNIFLKIFVVQIEAKFLLKNINVINLFRLLFLAYNDNFNSLFSIFGVYTKIVIKLNFFVNEQNKERKLATYSLRSLHSQNPYYLHLLQEITLS